MTVSLNNNVSLPWSYVMVAWLVLSKTPYYSYSLLGVVQLPTDVRMYGDTHSSVLRGFRGYFYYLPIDNEVQCCHLVSPSGNADLLCNDSAIIGVLTTALRVNAAVPAHHTGAVYFEVCSSGCRGG